MLQGAWGLTAARNVRGSEAVARVRQLAQDLGAVYVDRPHNEDLETLRQRQGLTALLVLEAVGLRIHSAAGSFAYHPGMAVLRLQQLQRGGTEHLLTALDVHRGSRVLDATLGLGADAALAAWAVGEQGCVIGLEASPLLYVAVAYGLAHYEAAIAELTQALRRIRPVQAQAEAYLAQCAADSFDVVYFDPMFRQPVPGAKGMDALRPLSYDEPLRPEAVAAALHAAPRVVIKERSRRLLESYGCSEFVGGRYSRFQYGIIRR